MQNLSTWIQRYPSLKLAQLLISSSKRGNQGQGSMELSRAAINNMRSVEHALGFLATSTRIDGPGAAQEDEGAAESGPGAKPLLRS